MASLNNVSVIALYDPLHMSTVVYMSVSIIYFAMMDKCHKMRQNRSQNV